VARKGISSGGENEHHVVAARLRVTGEGNLNFRLESLSQYTVQDLVPFTMQVNTNIEPTRLANFQSQRIRYILNTTNLNEHFQISRIILFAKPVAVEYPM